MVKAIQVGLGHWGFSWTKEVIPKVPNIHMVGYVDSSPEATKRVQTELGIEEKRCFSSLDEAAQGVEADLAICTLRTEAHYPVVKRCLEFPIERPAYPELTRWQAAIDARPAFAVAVGAKPSALTPAA